MEKTIPLQSKKSCLFLAGLFLLVLTVGCGLLLRQETICKLSDYRFAGHCLARIEFSSNSFIFDIYVRDKDTLAIQLVYPSSDSLYSVELWRFDVAEDLTKEDGETSGTKTIALPFHRPTKIYFPGDNCCVVLQAYEPDTVYVYRRSDHSQLSVYTGYSDLTFFQEDIWLRPGLNKVVEILKTPDGSIIDIIENMNLRSIVLEDFQDLTLMQNQYNDMIRCLARSQPNQIEHFKLFEDLFWYLDPFSKENHVTINFVSLPDCHIIYSHPVSRFNTLSVIKVYRSTDKRFLLFPYTPNEIVLLDLDDFSKRSFRFNEKVFHYGISPSGYFWASGYQTIYHGQVLGLD